MISFINYFNTNSIFYNYCYNSFINLTLNYLATLKCLIRIFLQKCYILTIVIILNGDLNGNDSRNDGCSGKG